MGIKCRANLDIADKSRKFRILDPVENLSSILNMYVEVEVIGTDIKFRCSLYNYAQAYRNPQEVLIFVPKDMTLPLFKGSVTLHISKVSDEGII